LALYRLFTRACDGVGDRQAGGTINPLASRGFFQGKRKLALEVETFGGGRPNVPRNIRKLIHEMSIVLIRSLWGESAAEPLDECFQKLGDSGKSGKTAVWAQDNGQGGQCRSRPKDGRHSSASCPNGNPPRWICFRRADKSRFVCSMECPDRGGTGRRTDVWARRSQRMPTAE